MTLILAGKDKEGHVWMGADSRASNGESYFDGNKKLLKQHNYVVGFSGSFRVLQIIENNPKKFKPIKSDADMYHWCNALKDLLEDQGYAGSNGGSEPSFEEVWMLVGTPNQLYVMFSNFQFHRMDRWAIGSGWKYGLGYLDALTRSTDLPLSITESIIKTAAVDPSVSPDAEVVMVKGGK